MPLLRVHSDSPIVSPLEDDKVEASQPAVYPIVASTPDVHAPGHCKRYRATGPHRVRVDGVAPPADGDSGRRRVSQ